METQNLVLHFFVLFEVSIRTIPRNRNAPVGTLDPQLMRPTGSRSQFQNCESTNLSLEALFDPHSGLSPDSRTRLPPRPTALLSNFNPVAPDRLVFLRPTKNQSHVGFLYPVLREGFFHLLRRFFLIRHQNHPGGSRIQTMQQPNLTSTLVRRNMISLVFQRIAARQECLRIFATLLGLGPHPAWFV